MKIRWVWLPALATTLVMAFGCSPPCETASEDPVFFKGGEYVATCSTYETSPWGGPYLHFPGGRRYRIYHGLGQVPPVVNTYVAFHESPIPGNNVSENTGNQGVIEDVNADYIQIRNDTCADLYLRVVASAASPADAGICDSGTD